MNGPSVTVVPRIVFAFETSSSWLPGSASLPLAVYLSYHAQISPFHAEYSSADRVAASGVFMIRTAYFIASPCVLGWVAAVRDPLKRCYVWRPLDFDTFPNSRQSRRRDPSPPGARSRRCLARQHSVRRDLEPQLAAGRQKAEPRPDPRPSSADAGGFGAGPPPRRGRGGGR